jgi:hypothetical protein
MDLLTVFGVMVRRWYVVVPTLLVTALMAVFLQFNATPMYQASGSILLTESQVDPSGLPALVVSSPRVSGAVQEGPAGTAASDEDQQFTLRRTGDGFEVAVVADSASTAESWARALVDDVVRVVGELQAEAEIPEDERLQVTGISAVTTSDERPDGTFEARGSIALQDPTADYENPFPANNATGRVLEVAVMSDAGRARAADLTAPGVRFEVTQDGTDRAPILEISTFGAEPSDVLAAFDQVATVVDEELQRRQERAEVPSTQRVGVEALAEPRNVVNVSPPVSRSVATIIALGLLAAPVLAVATENLRSPRLRRWQRELPDPWLWPSDEGDARQPERQFEGVGESPAPGEPPGAAGRDAR